MIKFFNRSLDVIKAISQPKKQVRDNEKIGIISDAITKNAIIAAFGPVNIK